MHNNYYFLRQLSVQLESILKGSVVSECFSQSLDELIIRFEIGRQSFVIRASLQPGLGCLSFPGNLHRAKKNSVDLFNPVIGQRVSSIRQFRNERSFAIMLSSDLTLLFKMHGSRANIVLLERGAARDLFRNNLAADLSLNLETLDRDIDWSFDHFTAHRHDLRSTYFTFGKIVWRYLEEQDFFEKSPEAQWHTFEALLAALANPSYYITDIDEKPVLALVRTGDIKRTWTNPVEAANDFFHSITGDFVLSKERSTLLRALKAKLASGTQYCEKNRTRLTELRHDERYKQWADLIMANLHAIPPGSEKILLDDFQEGNAQVAITLRKDLTPQRNAELYYKKAKNRHIEIEKIESSIRQKQEAMQQLREDIRQVETATDLKSLRALSDKIDPKEGQEKKQRPSLPYREFMVRGYRIWVGKSAEHNDTLTSKFSYKDDLWLHAKDVAGSHVIIKHQSGKTFPKDVVEYAASLAAGNSKRKNESMCPVIVTPRKFVRKRKGDPPGVVVVEREEVIMVEPRVS